ncbi:twin-arginine translocase TatA/TatE family subunit [Halobacteriales archaeon SW_6_65_15]|jgi:sec-independent protein translocase protein TatA|nr:MAG: twin-arginine translocase TatA/TatE family subunit [Halobacteriales archaeon SW_6_65_15]
MFETIPLFGPVPGGMEMMVILLIAVLLFGANKIPKLARSTGEAMGEFKKGRQEIEDELQEAQDEVAPDTDAVEPDAEADTTSA